jgi:hypothetical protein
MAGNALSVTFSASSSSELNNLIRDFLMLSHQNGHQAAGVVHDMHSNQAIAQFVPVTDDDLYGEQSEEGDTEAPEPAPKKSRGRPKKADNEMPDTHLAADAKTLHEEAMDMLRIVAAKPGGMDLIRPIQKEFGVAKLATVPLDQAIRLRQRAAEAYAEVA